MGVLPTDHSNHRESCGIVVLTLRRQCRDRGSNLFGVENFISALKTTMFQSTTSVSLVVVKSLLGSRVSVKCCVCSKCLSSPGSSAPVIIASTWNVMSLDKKCIKKKKLR